MSCSAKLIEDWNQVFSFKINESDLISPTEAFLTNALINYLKMFNFDIASMINANNSENAADSKKFQIKLCQYIDHIYKVSKSSGTFAFYDLKHPTPKKTVHLLSFLLNYLSYCNMFKELTIKKSLEKITIYDELKEKINKINIDIEKMNIKACNIEKKIHERRNEIPKLIERLDSLINEDKHQKEKVYELRTTLNKCRSSLDLLLKQEKQLQSQIVTQDEANSLKIKHSNLQLAINKEEEMGSKINALCKEQSEQIETRMRVKKLTEEAKVYPKSLLESYNQAISDCQIAKSDFEKLNEKSEELTRKKDLAYLEFNELKGKKNSIENELKSLLIENEDKTKLIEIKTIDTKSLEDELQESEKKLTEEREVKEYLVMKTKKILDYHKPYYKNLNEKISKK